MYYVYLKDSHSLEMAFRNLQDEIGRSEYDFSITFIGGISVSNNGESWFVAQAATIKRRAA